MIRVLFFATARDAAGTGEIAIDAESAGPTVEALRDCLLERIPALQPIAGEVRFARNGQFAEGGCPVEDGDEIALIPPVSGG